MDETFVIEIAQVARVEPAVLEDRFRLRLSVVIALHYVAAPGNDLPVHALYFIAGHGPASRPYQDFSGPGKGDHGGGLSHAKTLEHLESQGLEVLAHLLVQFRSPAHKVLDLAAKHLVNFFK